MSTATIASLFRATQSWCEQLCEKNTLQFGIAFFAERFPQLAEANQFREIVVEDAAQAAEAIREAETQFAAHGLTVRRWSPAAGAHSPALERLLLDRGFTPQRHTAWRLGQWPEPTKAEGVRILPARAMRTALPATIPVSGFASDEARSQAVEAVLDRLDDAQLDLVVAMVGDRAVGRCGLYQVGDIGQIVELCTSPGHDDAACALACHTLALAHRLAIRNVCAIAPDNSQYDAAFWEHLGFVADGEFVEYTR